MNRTQLLTILIPICAALAVNAAVIAFGWSGNALGRSLLDPPGALIGAVWTGLIALMGYTLWLAWRSPDPAASALKGWIVALILLCLSYPFYTRGLQSSPIGLAGNAATFVYALILTIKSRGVSGRIAPPLMPLLLWLVYAGMITTHKILNGG